MKIFSTWLIILFVIFTKIQLTAQPTLDDALDYFEFKQEVLISDTDTIIYYLKNYQTKPSNLIVFIQGTDANPLFSYSIRDGKTAYYRWFGDDYKRLDSTYTFAIIPKPGMASLYQEGNIVIPPNYHKKNYLDYRVKQLDASINHIINEHLSEHKNIIVYGHSEGAVIGAALANKNNNVTHLGFWSGNVLNNFYEFALFNRISSLKGEISDENAHENINDIFDWYSSVIKEPHNTNIDDFGFTNKRWSSYEKAPLDYLLELDIPIYGLFSSEDESTPIETAYLLPIKFMENRKDNLSFEVCLGCDHAYQKVFDGKHISTWSDQFLKFISWTKGHVAP